MACVSLCQHDTQTGRSCAIVLTDETSVADKAAKLLCLVHLVPVAKHQLEWLLVRSAQGERMIRKEKKTLLSQILCIHASSTWGGPGSGVGLLQWRYACVRS